MRLRDVNLLLLQSAGHSGNSSAVVDGYATLAPYSTRVPSPPTRETTVIPFRHFPTLNLRLFSIIGMVLICCLAAAAQTTTTTTTLTPAQQRAQARAAQQAAAKQAAEQRQAAAKQAAEQRQAAKQAGQSNATNGTTPAGTGTAANTTQRPLAGATNPAGATTTSGTATGTAARSGTAPGSSTAKAGSSGTVGSGTLAWGTRVYSSSGCVHNGNSAVCTFTFVNQGNQATLNAGGAGELSGIQLVDDAHVPHRWTEAHFLDKYGTQQPRLIVQPGDTGTYVVTFENVNPQVSSADFHLRTQIVGGVTFSGAQSATAKNPETTASPAAAPAK
jgi:hypothetical protein